MRILITLFISLLFGFTFASNGLAKNTVSYENPKKQKVMQGTESSQSFPLTDDQMNSINSQAYAPGDPTPYGPYPMPGTEESLYFPYYLLEPETNGTVPSQDLPGESGEANTPPEDEIGAGESVPEAEPSLPTEEPTPAPEVVNQPEVVIVEPDVAEQPDVVIVEEPDDEVMEEPDTEVIVEEPQVVIVEPEQPEIVEQPPVIVEQPTEQPEVVEIEQPATDPVVSPSVELPEPDDSEVSEPVQQEVPVVTTPTPTEPIAQEETATESQKTPEVGERRQAPRNTEERWSQEEYNKRFPRTTKRLRY